MSSAKIKKVDELINMEASMQIKINNAFKDMDKRAQMLICLRIYPNNKGFKYILCALDEINKKTHINKIIDAVSKHYAVTPSSVNQAIKREIDASYYLQPQVYKEIFEKKPNNLKFLTTLYYLTRDFYICQGGVRSRNYLDKLTGKL